MSTRKPAVPAGTPNETSPLPFTAAEFAARRDRVAETLRQKGIDVLLVTSPVNYYYLTGLHTGVTHYVFLLALRQNGEGLWIGRHTEMSNVRALAPHSWVKEGVSISDSEDSYARLAQILKDRIGPNITVGLDFASPMMPVQAHAGLQAAAPYMKFVNAAGVVESLRAVKSEAELAYMRKAGAICGTAMERAIGKVRYGAKDSDLAADLIAEVIREGSEPMSMGPFITCGQYSYRAHSSWRHARIERGELVNTEMAAVVARYNTPIFRVSVMGKPSDEVQRFHDASMVGLRAGMEKIKPGMTSHQADTVVRDAIGKTGYGEYFTVRAAYGIGVGLPPGWGENNVMSIRPDDQRVLQPGMCFHLVPALYKSDLGCVCCSMPIHITDSGVEALTAIEAKLFVIEA
jgi:Xaa-Pro dipeptidase